MARIKVDLHDVFNRGHLIDAALHDAMRQAMQKRVPTVEIIHGRGKGQLKKRVLKYLEHPEVPFPVSSSGKGHEESGEAVRPLSALSPGGSQ